MRSIEAAVKRATDPRLPADDDDRSAIAFQDQRLLARIAQTELPEGYVDRPERIPRNLTITGRERDILRLVRNEAIGLKEIALRLDMSYSAVREHSKNARRILGAHSTWQAALIAEQRGLL